MPEFTFLLSPNLQTTKHTALAVTVSKIISGIEGCFLESKVLKDMSRLIQQGQSLIARDGSEIGCWKNRSKHIEFFEPVDDQSHYVWAPRKFSDYAITWWFIPN